MNELVLDREVIAKEAPECFLGVFNAIMVEEPARRFGKKRQQGYHYDAGDKLENQLALLGGQEEMRRFAST